MTQPTVNFFDFIPSARIQSLFLLRVNQFLDFVPAESQVRVLIKKLQSNLGYQGFLLMNTGWGEFKVAADESDPEILLDQIGSKLKHLVNNKRKSMKEISEESRSSGG